MGMIWWILPAICGVLGLMLGFAGIGKLFKLRPFGGLVRLAGGASFMAGAIGVAAIGLNLQTYKRLTHERDVATVRFNEVGNEANTYAATFTLEGEAPKVYTFAGDEFEFGGRVLKFKAVSNMLGFDSVYRPEYLAARNRNRYVYGEVRDANVPGVSLTPDPGLSVAYVAKSYGDKLGISDVTETSFESNGGAVDTKFGSAVYGPMGDGYEYQISITQSGFVLRSTNDKTKRAIDRQDYPGNKGIQ